MELTVARRLLSRALLGALALLLCAAAAHTTLAQQTPEEEDNTPPRPYINLDLQLDDNGIARIHLSGFLPENSVRVFKPALESSLGCSLEEEQRYRESPYFCFARCAVPINKAGLVREVRFNPAPLQTLAGQYEVEAISAQFTLPDTKIAETVPPSPQTQLPDEPQYARAREYLGHKHFFVWSKFSPGPAEVLLRFGYPAKAWPKALAILGFFLLAPILLVYWLGRRALDAPSSSVPTIWFSYLRYLQWTLTGSLLLWWAAIETVDLPRMLRFALFASGARWAWLPWILSGVIAWAPSALIWIACLVLSGPVQQKLRGIVWTSRELALQAIYSFSGSFLPIALWIGALLTFTSGSYRAAVILFLSAFVFLIVARGKLARLLGMQPEALTSGDLRDVAFAIAARIGVQLQQIYIIPAGRGRMANAFARTGNTIAFTDYLLARMSKREVNFVIAHELTHLRAKHPQKLAIAAGLAAGAIVTLLSVSSFPFVQSPFLRYGLIFGATIFAVYLCSRRFEYAADRGAVASTNDPQAAISALFKLAGLNMHPLQWSRWSEKWVTHPSTMRRAQAIAKRAGIPESQVDEVGNTPLQQETHYAIPEDNAAGRKVLTTTRKMSNIRWIAFSILGATIFAPAFAAFLAQLPRWSAAQRNALYAAGLLIAVALYFLLANSLGARSLRFAIPTLEERLRSSHGIETASWNGIPVGLSPADRPRIYEGHTQWDLGFLFLCSDRICYWGEETRFALRREQITEIRLGPNSPNWFRTRRVYIAWKDEERQTCGVFSVACAYPGTVLKLRKHTVNFSETLTNWWRARSSGASLPMPMANLSSPSFGEVTGHNPAVLMNGAKLFKELWLTGLLAMMAAVLFGLPFHLVEYIAGNKAGGVTYQGPGAGWYVIAAALGVRFFQFLPFLLYKDKPVLQAPFAPRTAPSFAPTPAEGNPPPQGRENPSLPFKG
jgi:Zn-dependent protease with chaperone function